MFHGDHVTLEESVVKVMSVGWGEHYIFGEPMGAGGEYGRLAVCRWVCYYRGVSGGDHEGIVLTKPPTVGLARPPPLPAPSCPSSST